MQMMQILLGALCLIGVEAARSSPINKVMELLAGLEEKIVKEGEEAAKLKAEKDEWCKDTTVNLGFEIKTATEGVADLEAKIDKQSAAIGSLDEKIEELVADISKDDKDLKAATKIREEELSDFEAEEKELSEIVDTLQRAIGILEKELSKTPGAALVQVQSAAGVVAALETMVQASVFTAADSDRLNAFIQSSDDPEGAPDAAAYESKAGGIVDVLEDLLDKARTQLSDARSKESKAAHEYEMLKQALEDSLKYANKDMEDAKKAKAKAGEEKSAAEGELEATSKDLAEDKATLEEVTKDCAAYSEEYEAEVKSRAEELAAVKKAKEIVAESTKDAAAVDTGLAQTAQTASFLQLRRAARTAHEQATVRVVRFVRELARKSKSAALAQLASHMKSAVRLAGGEDPFAKIKGLITELIEKLEKEAAQDAEQKAYCEREMKDAKEKKADKTETIEELATKIDQMTAKSEKLKDSIATMQKELSELAETQKEMDKLRREENELFLEQKKALSDGITGVEGAMKVLQDYYAKEKDHDANDGAAEGIIGMLEVCLADFTKSLADIAAAEDSAQSEYEVETQNNKEATATKSEAVKYETKEVAELEKAVAEHTADRATTQSELDAVLEYLDKLTGSCVAKPETFEMRAERRQKEIEGLKQALEILG